ncbi:MAG: glycoside hydrolase family 15 protein [Deltaproteobacteria bacterium]|nr:glycoside hydrolase family 15 protein [Deltaproteobacteria bacterium]
MDYGLIGNCKSSALVHRSGSIDWCCLPNFNSPSTFARLLDPGGGHFSIELDGGKTVSQAYLPSTNILVTRQENADSAIDIIDYMPRYMDSETAYHRPPEIHRIIKPLRGMPHVRIQFVPRLNYAQGETHTTLRPSLITASNGLESVFLYSNLALPEMMHDGAMPVKEDAYLLLTYHEKIQPPTQSAMQQHFERTKAYWEHWVENCSVPKVATEAVLRSALALKLMAFDETGAIIAAPTTSLPEIVGECRNWDYRYCWLRDAPLVLESLKSIGHFTEAREFIRFLLRLFESKQSEVQIVYGIGGERDIEEYTLPHLAGYQNSIPVRVGNNACLTHQNDVFGEMLNTLYLYYGHYGLEPLTDEVWSLTKFLVNSASKEWEKPDASIWEFRGLRAHFTFSKVLSWVALDRGVRLAELAGKSYAAERWGMIREKIREDIEANGWDPQKQAYTQAYGVSHMDASVLLMARYGFLKPTDERWRQTVERCETELIKNGWVFRYTAADDFGVPKTAFLLASFWMAKAFATIGQKDKAYRLFEKILAARNHVGLLSEDIDIETGELLGNFPQAYSHMAVINTAMLLDDQKNNQVSPRNNGIKIPTL